MGSGRKINHLNVLRSSSAINCTAQPKIDSFLGKVYEMSLKIPKAFIESRKHLVILPFLIAPQLWNFWVRYFDFQNFLTTSLHLKMYFSPTENNILYMWINIRYRQNVILWVWFGENWDKSQWLKNLPLPINELNKWG